MILVFVGFLVFSSPSLDLTPQWIYSTLSPMLSSLTFADMDGDSIDELIATTYGSGPNPYEEGVIYVIDLNGTDLPGWPLVITQGPIPSTAVVGDLNQDGLNEIFVGSWMKAHLLDGQGAYLPGWPISHGAYYSPSLCDIDSDDALEIVYPSSNSLLYVFEVDGSTLPGFPVSVPHDYPGTPATGDVDGDGEPEIVSGINRGPVTPGQFELFAWNSDGTVVDGFPVFLCGIIKSSPAIADVDQDGTYEIVVDAYHSSNYDSLYVIGGGGDIWPGWPQGVPGCRLSSPAVGDLFPDEPGLEIVVGGGGTISPPMNAHLFVLSNTGSFLSSIELPVGSGINSSPLLVDLDGDNELEIMVKIQDAICAYEREGTPVSGFPYALSDSAHSGTTSPTPVVGDPDNDGLLEMAFASCYGEIHYLETEIPFYSDSTPWPMYKHDERNSSRLPSPFEPTVVERKERIEGGFMPYPNPFTRRIFFSKTRTQEPLELAIFAPSGRIIFKKTYQDEPVFWDGRDGSGNSLPSGVFLVLVTEGGKRSIYKIVKR